MLSNVNFWNSTGKTDFTDLAGIRSIFPVLVWKDVWGKRNVLHLISLSTCCSDLRFRKLGIAQSTWQSFATQICFICFSINNKQALQKYEWFNWVSFQTIVSHVQFWALFLQNSVVLIREVSSYAEECSITSLCSNHFVLQLSLVSVHLFSLKNLWTLGAKTVRKLRNYHNFKIIANVLYNVNE